MHKSGHSFEKRDHLHWNKNKTSKDKINMMNA